MEGHEHDPGLIAAYIEGRLQGDEKNRFTDHLAACAECRGTLALLAREADALGASAPGGGARGDIAASPAVWLPVAAALIVATVIGLRSGWLKLPEPSPPPATSPGRALAAPSGRPPRPSLMSPVPQLTPTPAASRRIDDRLLVKRGGERRVAGKTFHLVAGEWRDAAFDPTAGLPIVEVQEPRERGERLSRIPGLAPYAALGPRVVVVFEGTVYRFRPPSR